MKRTLSVVSILIATLLMSTPARAVLINFDDLLADILGNISGVPIHGQVFSVPVGRLSVCQDNCAETGYVSARNSIVTLGTQYAGLTAITVRFDAPVKSVQITGGDSGGDDDTFYLNAYDGADALVASASTPTFGGNPIAFNGFYTDSATLSVSAPSIAYAVFQFTSGPNPGGGSFDNLVFEYVDGPPTPAPEPSTVLLISLGLAGLAATRRRKQ